MGVQSFAVCEGGYHRPETLEAVCSHLLRGDVLLERQCIDAAELPRIAVRRESVVRARGVVPAAANTPDKTNTHHAASKRTSYLSGEYGPTNTLPAFSTAATAAGASARWRIRCSGA